MRKLLLLFVVILTLVPATVLAQDQPPPDPGIPAWILGLIQIVIPAVIPALTAALKSLVSGLTGPAAFWVNWLLNIVAQIVAVLLGGSPELGGALAAAGGPVGSYARDAAAGKTGTGGRLGRAVR